MNKWVVLIREKGSQDWPDLILGPYKDENGATVAAEIELEKLGGNTYEAHIMQTE